MKSIQDILAPLHIDTLVYVDDEFGKGAYYDNIRGKVRQAISDGHQYATYPFFANNEVWEEEFDNWWNQATIEEVKTLANKFDAQMLIPNTASKLLDLIPKNLKVDLLAPEQFCDAYKQTLIEDLDRRDKFAIILVDFDLKGYHYKGDHLLANIGEHKNVFCGVFSQTFEVSDEIHKWEERHFNKNVYPLSKKRFTEEDVSKNSIIQGIKNIIWLKQIGSIKEMANNAAKNALRTLENGLNEIDPATFNRMVIDSAKAEGCWEFENLYRIIQIYINKGVRNEIKKLFSDFQKRTNSLRDFNDNSQNEYVNSNLLNSIKNEEIYENIEYVNGVYSAITNGDIFQINKKYYILLGQPCNLAIRKGSRSNQVDQAFLIPLTDSEKGICDKLQYPYENSYKFAIFSQRKRISLSVLDLVSYNENGETTIDLTLNKDNLVGHEIMQENMLLRYDKIKDKINDYYQIYNRVSEGNVKNENKQIERFFCKPFEMGDVVKRPEIKGMTITFGIKRVGRYYAYGAHVLLQQFMGYMSRPGFPVDFDRC